MMKNVGAPARRTDGRFLFDALSRYSNRAETSRRRVFVVFPVNPVRIAAGVIHPLQTFLNVAIAWVVETFLPFSVLQSLAPRSAGAALDCQAEAGSQENYDCFLERHYRFVSCFICVVRLLCGKFTGWTRP
jgi:hypothetical protein